MILSEQNQKLSAEETNQSDTTISANENTNSNQCGRCSHYDAYYTLGQKTFNKTKCGMCSEKREVVQMHDTCENFSRKRLFRRRCYMLKRTLNGLLAEITDIRKVLECDEID